MNKGKGIQDDTKILTIPDLMARVDEELEKQLKVRKKREAANKASLAVAVQEERDIIDKIGKAKKIVKKLIAEFQAIEAKTITEKRKEAEGAAIREADVRSGKANLKDFHSKGKRDSAILSETRQKSVAELESSLKLVRQKNLEILMLEDSLGECRNTIRGLSMQPGRFMIDMLKGLREFTEQEQGAFMGELESSRTSWHETKEKILLTQGKSMSGRYVWDGLSMAQARSLQFSPLLPLSCVEKLKSELETYEGSENISLTLYTRIKDIEITSISPRQSGVIQTIEVKEDKQDGTKFTREKSNSLNKT